MRNIDEIVDEIKQFFNNNISITNDELDLIIIYLIDEFKKDFPERKAIYLNINFPKKVYFTDIDSNILEIEKVYYDSGNNIFSSISQYTYNNEISDSLIPLQERIAVKIQSEYINDFFIDRNAFYPPIFSDSTGEYIVLQKSSLIFYKKVREIILTNIPEYVYKLLYHFIYYKMIDQFISEDYKYRTEKIATMLDQIYKQYLSDMTNNQRYDVASLSLGSMSISFKSTAESYSNILSRLAQNLKIDPTFAKQLEQIKNEHKKIYKRKKMLYFSGQI